MTGTLSGYLVYRVQHNLKLRGHEIPYEDLIRALTMASMDLDRDMEAGEVITLPTGRELTIGKEIKS
jgi:hypothetical protein